MIVTISSQSDNLDAQPSLRFGRAPYFIKYDLQNGNWEAINNEAVFQSGGAGVAASQLLIDNKTSAALSGSFGPNAHRALSSAGIKMYTFDDSYKTIEEVIEAFKSNKLNEILP
jgi:predicted Fe-Mo cluster-binding NifX family protein